MASVEECRSLIKYFNKTYKNRHGHSPSVNNYTARWGFDAMLMSLDKDDVKELIDFYFRLDNEHKLDWLFYHYSELYETMQQQKEDEEFKKTLREQTKKRVEEWRKEIDRP